MMRFTEILDGAFSLYRKHFWLFFWLCTLYFICETLRMIVSEFLVNEWIAFFIDDILSWLLFTLICGLMIIPTSEIYLGQQITLKQVIQRYLAQVYTYFGCSIIYVAIFLLPDLFPDSETVTFIGYPIIVYIHISWIFYGPVLIIENTTTMEAFGRSRYLVHGKWWRVWWNVIKLIFLLLSISLILTLSFVILIQMFGFFDSEASLWDVIKQQLRLLIDPDHTPTSVADWITTIFYTAIEVWLTPIYAISITILYYNLRSQKVDFNKEGEANGNPEQSHH